jgi:GntR family transcriptional regulator/MocR family aminotransferase
MGPLQQILADLGDAPPRRLTHTLYSLMVAAILEGRLAHGLRLPASRELARDIGVSRNTVVSVYDRLMNEGYAVPRQGRGVFVTHAAQKSRPRSAGVGEGHYRRHVATRWQGVEKLPVSKAGIVHDLFPGVPDTSYFPADVWRRLCARAARHHRFGEHAYGETQGREGLRGAIASHLSLTRAVSCEAADVVVAGGTQQAVDLLCRFLVTPGKTVVAIEEPGYVFVRRAFEMVGARVVPVPVDADGLVVARLPEDVDLIFVAPSHQFPMGCVMPPRRRRELIAFATARGALIVEDDYQAEFPVPGKPADALQSLDTNEMVFYIGTFSKCMFPELRLGFVVAPRWAIPPLLAAKQLSFHENSPLEQDALAAFIAEGHLARHIRRMREVYAVKRDAMALALGRHCRRWVRTVNTDGGAYVTVELCDTVHAVEAAQLCRARGIRLMPLAGLYSGRPEVNGFCIGLGRVPLNRIDAAIAGLATVLAGM